MRWTIDYLNKIRALKNKLSTTILTSEPGALSFIAEALNMKSSYLSESDLDKDNHDHSSNQPYEFVMNPTFSSRNNSDFI